MHARAERQPFLTVEDVARLLGIPPKQVYNLPREEQLPCYRIGRRVRFDPAEFERWLSARKDSE